MSLSVIISTYNHAHFLTECLTSILSQEKQAQEVIIIDDASTDHTRELVESFQATHPEIILLTNSKNLGPALSLNKALAVAKGEYIIGCAADDFVTPGFFEKGVAFMNANPKIGFCCGDTYHFFDVKPYRFQFIKTLDIDETKVFDRSTVQKLFQTKAFTIQSHACIYRKACLLENGGFLPELKSLCDWYLNICLALKWGFGYIPHPFAAYRLSMGSYANANAKDATSREKILHSLFDLLDQPANATIKPLFKSCFLFSQLNYRYFLDFLKNPRYWELTLSSFPKKLKNLIAKRWSNLLWKGKNLFSLNN